MLSELRFANLLPFRGEHKIVFPEGIISIEGRYKGNSNKSNRAGKSSIFDILRFVLYEMSRNSRTMSIIHKGADPKNDPIYATAVFNNRETGQELSVTRQYNPLTGRFEFFMPTLGETLKKKETQSVLAGELGCDHDYAALTWLCLQGDSYGLMARPAAERKEFLLDIFRTQTIPWDTYYTEACTRLSTVRSRIAIATEGYNAQKAKLDTHSLDELKAKQETLEGELEACAIKKDKLARRISELKAGSLKTQLEELGKKISVMKTDVLNTTTTIDHLRRSISLAEANVAKHTRLVDEVKKAEDALMEVNARFNQGRLEVVAAKSDSLRREIDLSNAEHRTLMRTYNDLGMFTGVCPITNRNCESGASVETYKVSVERKLAKLEETMNKLSAEDAKVYAELESLRLHANKHSTIVRALESYKREMVSLKPYLKNLEEGREQIAVLEAQWTDKTAQLKLLTEQLKKLSRVEDTETTRALHLQEQEYSGIIAREREIQKNLTDIIASIRYRDTLEVDVRTARKEVRRLTKRIDGLVALKTALAKDGLPFFSLLTSITEFEHALNLALQELGTDLRVLVEPYKELSTMVKVCMTCGFEFTNAASKCPVCSERRKYNRKETLDLKLVGNAFDVDFEEDSGGGKLLVSLAARLALYSVLKDRGYLRNIDFFILDEVFAPLDMANRQRMTFMLEDLMSTYGLSQTFLVSHTDMSDVIQPTIIIERNEAKGYSTIIS